MGVVRLRKNAHGGVDHHVILLALVNELARKSGHDGILRVRDAHGVGPDVRVADEMATDHPFVAEVTAERVAHTTVDSRKAGAFADG